MFRRIELHKYRTHRFCIQCRFCKCKFSRACVECLIHLVWMWSAPCTEMDPTLTRSPTSNHKSCKNIHRNSFHRKNIYVDTLDRGTGLCGFYFFYGVRASRLLFFIVCFSCFVLRAGSQCHHFVLKHVFYAKSTTEQRERGRKKYGNGFLSTAFWWRQWRWLCAQRSRDKRMLTYVYVCVWKSPRRHERELHFSTTKKGTRREDVDEARRHDLHGTYIFHTLSVSA